MIERTPASLTAARRHEVQLAQRALVDLGRDRHPLELGVVADEVLDARRHALGLQTLHVRDRDA